MADAKRHVRIHFHQAQQTGAFHQFRLEMMKCRQDQWRLAESYFSDGQSKKAEEIRIV